MSSHISIISFFVFAVVALAYKHEVHCLPEDDASFGDVRLSLQGALHGDGTYPNFSFSPTNGLKVDIQGWFTVCIRKSVNITTEVFSSRMLELCTQLPSSCFWMQDSRRFSQAATLSVYGSFISLR